MLWTRLADAARVSAASLPINAVAMIIGERRHHSPGLMREPKSPSPNPKTQIPNALESARRAS
jgi:hypothetical protein